MLPPRCAKATFVADLGTSTRTTWRSIVYRGVIGHRRRPAHPSAARLLADFALDAAASCLAEELIVGL